MIINISDFTYDLPDEKIAKFPVNPRDSSKLLCYNSGKISHHSFAEIASVLPHNALLVFNNTKVIPARLFFQRVTGATIEVFLLHAISPSSVISITLESQVVCHWQCVIGNKKKWKPDETLSATFWIGNKTCVVTAQWTNYAENIVQFNWSEGFAFSEVLASFGNIPLPPYLNRNSENSDKIDYQTVFSKYEGAVAAPTAGLHFSENIVSEISAKGIQTAFITLHVGAGTFLPVKVENVLEHPMHSEQMVFSKEFIEDLSQFTGKVIPVGTTSMRSLESLFWFGQMLKTNPNADFFVEKLYPYQNPKTISRQESLELILNYFERNAVKELVGATEIMIFPGYDFKICEGLVTNFHQPKSTLLLLIAALVGQSRWKEIYKEALANNYRFLSFGDSSLLLK